MPAQVYEGTWEELLIHAREFEGRRLMVILLPEGSHDAALSEARSFNRRKWEAVMADLARGAEKLPILADKALTRAGLYQDHD
ncbi:MAG: hypothetical protein IT210_02605 [Armatimonadetes bacterium]|nr:hypothetical protein [Armatimonadota bacterium]